MGLAWFSFPFGYIHRTFPREKSPFSARSFLPRKNSSHWFMYISTLGHDALTGVRIFQTLVLDVGERYVLLHAYVRDYVFMTILYILSPNLMCPRLTYVSVQSASHVGYEIRDN